MQDKTKKNGAGAAPSQLYLGLIFVFLWIPLQLSAREAFGVSLGSFSIPEDWYALSLHNKRQLAPYLLDEIRFSQNVEQARLFVKALEGEQDPVLLAYFRIAPIYFRTQNKGKILERLWSLRQTLHDKEARAVLSYFIGRESRERNRRLAICQLRSHKRICQWEYFVRELELTQQKPRLRKRQLQRLIRFAKPFLVYKNFWVPVSLPELARTSRELYQLGLPLEAALLTERFTWKHPAGRAALYLRQKIPYFLAGAGDFPSALRFSFGVTKNPDVFLRNSRLDWMILGGDYRRALDYLQRLGTKGFVTQKLATLRDPFSNFPYSQDGLRLRSAMLLYLAGDVASSARALKRLTAIRGEIGGAPARHFARLRLAQILLKTEPNLAHKIAEDMTYLAQEKSWYVLEYYATILDGWAQYFRGKYYKSLINFVKAQGILKGSDRPFYLTYSHTLGLLAVRQKLAPRGNYSALIRILQDYLSQNPKNEALFVLRDWVPKGFGADFFRELAWEHYDHRRRHSDAVHFLLEQRTWERSFFRVGKNPGGARGFASSARWIRLLANFPGNQSQPRLVLQGKAYALLKQERQNISASLPSVRYLSKTQAYAFSFSIGKRHVYYLLAPRNIRSKARGRRRSRLVRRLLWVREPLSARQYRLARNSCRKYEENCRFAYLQNLRIHLQKSKVRRLNILFETEEELDLRRLLAGDRTDMLPVFFNRLRGLPRQTGLFENRVFAAQACNWLGVSGKASRAFRFRQQYLQYQRPSRAIQIWPDQLDSAKSRSGHPRPVYLRRFLCGRNRLRLWDMERFAHPDGPALVIVPAWRNEEALTAALSEFFAKRKSALLFVQERERRKTRLWLETQQGQGRGSLLRAYRSLYANAPGTALVLPGLLP